MTELLVNEFGYLFGGAEVFPVDVTEHDWETPYPEFSARATLEWEPGDLGVAPNVFRHPEIRDWVCDDTAWAVLSKVAPSDLKKIGAGRLDGRPMHIVQVIAMVDADVVDLEASNIRDYGSYRVVEFPAFRRSAESGLRARVFRVPGSYTDLFIGSAVKAALDDAGITGLAYTPIPLTDG